MNYEEFKGSLSADKPPTGLTPALRALWYDGKEDWESSHNVAQDIHDRNGSWIHAYLHRKEGDLANARYWYSKAGRPEWKVSLQAEWEAIVKEIMGEDGEG